MTTDKDDQKLGADDLAVRLATFLNQSRYNGKPVTEGMVFSAIGVLFAAKAKDDADCMKTIRTLSTAIHSRYMMGKVK